MGLNRAKLEDPIAELETRVFLQHVLSLYLPATPVHRLGHHESVSRELAHRYSQQYLDKTSIPILKRERPAITAHLEQSHPPLGHAFALVTSTPANLMSSWVLPQDEEADLRIGTRVHTTPLRRQLALRPPALIVAIDKEKARIFTVLLCDMREIAEFEGEQVKRQRQGGWSSEAINAKRTGRATQISKPWQAGCHLQIAASSRRSIWLERLRPNRSFEGCWRRVSKVGWGRTCRPSCITRLRNWLKTSGSVNS
jgi:hypothetical protein